MYYYIYELQKAHTGFISQEPGLEVANVIVSVRRNCIPVLLMNHTNKTFKIKKGCILGKLEPVHDGTIASINLLSQTDKGQTEHISQA